MSGALTSPGMSPRGAEMLRAGTRSGVHLAGVGEALIGRGEHKDGACVLCMCCCGDGESDWALALALGGRFTPVFINSRVQTAPAAPNTMTLSFLADVVGR